jgi:hypothetical protein
MKQKLTSASWLRPVCGGFHNLIRFNCAPFFASCRRHCVLTVTCLDACRCAAYLRYCHQTESCGKEIFTRPPYYFYTVAKRMHTLRRSLIGDNLFRTLKYYLCCFRLISSPVRHVAIMGMTMVWSPESLRSRQFRKHRSTGSKVEMGYTRT